MKRFYFIIPIFISLVVLAGCELKENYAIEYGFSNELITQTTLRTVTSTVALETPFADFTCDVSSIKAAVARQNDTFTVTLAGTETSSRCSEKFSLQIHEIHPGTYWLKVIYNKTASQHEPVVYQQFTIQ